MSDALSFRTAIYKGSFRFDVDSSIWKTLYEFAEDGKTSNIITIKKDGVLRGYAVYFIFTRGEFKQFSVLDVCVDGKDTLSEIIDSLKEHAKEEDADLIYVRKAPDSNDKVFDQEGFLSVTESTIMLALLNPHEFLRALSTEISGGGRLRLNLQGFDPITIQVNDDGMKFVTDGNANLTVSTDSATFLRLVFCRTSFWKELLKGNLKVTGISSVSTARRFFNVIKQERWHIPLGDWV